MKLDKIRFAMLINWLSRNGLHELSQFELEDLDNMLDVQLPEPPKCNPNELHQLMALMQEGTRKIDAIKLHRAMTGYGLKESKDIVDKYWNGVSDTVRRIQDALGTAETGEALVEVARNAHKAEQELASQYNDNQFDKEEATLGDILNSATRC